MGNKEVHTGQALTLVAGVLAAITQLMPDIQAIIPHDVAVGVLLVTNILSATLPRIMKDKPPGS